MFPVLCALFLSAASAFAADVNMSIKPALISLLDRAVLTIEFTDTQGDAVEFPPIDGLKIDYSGPQTRYSIINGHSSSSISHTYIVTPTKVGDYTIGPVRVKYKGGEKALSAHLRVIKKADDQAAQELSEIMFSRITCSHPSPYVHEPFDLKMKLYIREDVQITESFSLTGGVPEQGIDGTPEWRVGRVGREEINGTIFNTYPLQTTLKTLTAGTFSFQPGIQVNVVVPRQQRRSYGIDDPFFGDFFGRQEVRPVVLDCNKLDIDVKPIPMKGRPASFTGGVGVMDFDVEVGPTRIKAGEPVTVKMHITGTGNMEKVTPPAIEETPDLKQYEAAPVPTETTGEILFEQAVIPISDSITEIPPVSFSYFNTLTADFRTITRGPFPITVDPSPQQTARLLSSQPINGTQKAEVLGHDIAYLKPLPNPWHTSDETQFFHTPLFRTLLVLPALLVAIAGIFTGRRNVLNKDVALARRQQAPKAARQNIQLAEQALKQKDANRFNEALWNALAAYFGHKLNLAPGEITLQILRSRIPDQADAIEQLYNQIEQRRYDIQTATGESPDQMKALLNQLVATLKQCERMKR
jgi:hypothetical protein